LDFEFEITLTTATHSKEIVASFSLRQQLQPLLLSTLSLSQELRAIFSNLAGTLSQQLTKLLS
jgi:hypothetical protein